jgi:predicted AAA+ superfamily ATPase
MGEFIEILKKWNPWERKLDEGTKRPAYIKKIISYIDRKEILVLKGIRRCGKSTIIKQIISELIKRGVNNKQILYLNLEDYGFANNLNLDLFDVILKEYLEYSKNKSKIYFFIDEIQKMPSWEKWIRTKYDLGENIKFIVTGSSAHLLSKELSTLLTGRNISFTIMPLSFNEFCIFKKNGNLNEYMKYGGFPEVVLEDSEEKKSILLQQYIEDIIYKDIIDRHSIRNANQLISLARYLISSSGSKVSVNKLSKVFGIAKDTISLYISYMVNAYLLFEVNYFSFSAKIRHEVSKLPKLYAADNGLITVSNIKYTQEKGRQFENTVLIKLFERYSQINYWGELTSEVDFIVSKTAINVTSTDSIPKREFTGLEDFKNKHENFSSLIITSSIKKEGIIPIIDFLKTELDY